MFEKLSNIIKKFGAVFDAFVFDVIELINVTVCHLSISGFCTVYFCACFYALLYICYCNEEV